MESQLRLGEYLKDGDFGTDIELDGVVRLKWISWLENLGFEREESDDDFYCDFGKHQGETLREIPRSYIAWCKGQEDPSEQMTDLIDAFDTEHRRWTHDDLTPRKALTRLLKKFKPHDIVCDDSCDPKDKTYLERRQDGYVFDNNDSDDADSFIVGDDFDDDEEEEESDDEEDSDEEEEDSDEEEEEEEFDDEQEFNLTTPPPRKRQAPSSTPPPPGMKKPRRRS